MRLEEARLAQESLAKKYGIYGFCYYHYWFNGKRLMETPVDRKLNNPKEDFPFMLCWANENWTRAWDGGDKEILIAQNYSEEDDKNHIHHLMKYFKDSRYIKIDGKPVFAVYRSTLLPNIKKTISIWREEAKKEGLELYITRFESFQTHGKEYLEEGFDAAIEFQPHVNVPHVHIEKKFYRDYDVLRLNGKIKYKIKQLLNYKVHTLKSNYGLLDYETHTNLSIDRYKSLEKYKLFRCVSPSWDNTARRKEGETIYFDSTPKKFGKWVKNALVTFEPYSKDENLFFINAWNEWAEGNHLEPCQKWGIKYLEEFKKSINEFS